MQQFRGKNKFQRSKTDVSTMSSTGNIQEYIDDNEMIKLLNRKGIYKLLPIQKATFPSIYNGQDIVAKDRTGSGKTLAFALPVITKMRKMKKFKGNPYIKFLVLLPTRELAIQVSDEMKSIRYQDRDDFVVQTIYGGTIVQDQLKALRNGVDIVVGTPGRVIDFIDRGALQLHQLQVICLDEADQMLNIGFQKDIQKIFKSIWSSNKNKVQCLMFSATIPNWIEKMSNLYQQKTRQWIDMTMNAQNKTAQSIKHYCLYSYASEKNYSISPIMKHFLTLQQTKTIIFCDTKADVQFLGISKLVPKSCAMLHGDHTQVQREKVYRNFKYGSLQCIIATNVAARGLDFPSIDLVIQIKPPTTTDVYIHRSGRTGRVGKPGICVTVYSDEDIYLMQRLELQAKIQFIHIDPRELEESLMKKKEARKTKNEQGRSNILEGKRRYGQQAKITQHNQHYKQGSITRQMRQKRI